MATISQNKVISFAGRFALVYFTLYVGTLSFDYFVFQPYFEWIGSPFRWLAQFTGLHIFGVNLLGAEEFYADTLIVYVHLFNLALIALFASVTWTFLSKKLFSETKLHPFLFTLLRYFLALNLFIYGFAKIYKWQFMLPEPNILFTPVGEMHRDMLYWTSMGTSRPYSIFMGMIEIIPAVLLLFRRTTLIGAFIAVFVMLNVVAVNFSFDITVKLHSMTLLLMSLAILIPGRKRITALFTGKSAEPFSYPHFTFAENRKWISPTVKIAVIALLLFEAHYPYTRTLNFNDDTAERPAMHGAYEVTDVTYPMYSRDEPLYIADDRVWIERVFIHRRGYIIFQYNNHTEDFPVTVDTINRQFEFDDRSIGYKMINDSTYEFEVFVTGHTEIWTARKVDWKKLPLLEEEFTWIDRD